MPNATYTGVSFPPLTSAATLTDGNAPMPGIAVKTSVPADDSAPNAATLFVGQYDGITDWLTYINKSAQWRPPVAPSGATSGYSAVAHVGAGAGTVTPSVGAAGGLTTTVRSVVIKITVAGTAGNADAGTFQWSNDGGTTFAAGVNPIPASYTEPTSGIIVTFSGAFTLNDSYSFQTADTPQAIWVDQVGNNRTVIDHSGYLMGRNCKLEAGWIDIAGAAAGGGLINQGGDSGSFQAISVGTGCALLATNTGAPSSTYPSWQAVINMGTANANKVNVYAGYSGAGLLHSGFAGLCAVFEWEVWFDNVGAATNVDYYCGLSSMVDMSGALTNCALFKKPGNAATWSVVNGGTATVLGSAFNPAANTPQRMRIEIYGTSGAAYTSRVRYFINEQHASTSSGLPGPAGLGFIFAGIASLGAPAPNSQQMFVGPVLGRWNRFLSGPSL